MVIMVITGGRGSLIRGNHHLKDFVFMMTMMMITIMIIMIIMIFMIIIVIIIRRRVWKITIVRSNNIYLPMQRHVLE